MIKDQFKLPKPRCGTMDKFYNYTKYNLYIEGERVPIRWKRLNHLNMGGN